MQRRWRRLLQVGRDVVVGARNAALVEHELGLGHGCVSLRWLRPRSGTEKHVTGLRPAGTKGRSFRGTTRFRRHSRRACCRRASLALVPIGAALITLALCAGAYCVAAPPPSRRRFGPGLTGPLALVSIPAYTSRRVSGLEDRGLLLPITASIRLAPSLRTSAQTGQPCSSKVARGS